MREGFLIRWKYMTLALHCSIQKSLVLTAGSLQSKWLFSTLTQKSVESVDASQDPSGNSTTFWLSCAFSHCFLQSWSRKDFDSLFRISDNGINDMSNGFGKFGIDWSQAFRFPLKFGPYMSPTSAAILWLPPKPQNIIHLSRCRDSKF